MSDIEYSESGVPIVRHQPREIEWEPPDASDCSVEEISAHIETHLGPIDAVFHELCSDFVHIDVHFVPPHKDRPFKTLVTTGMSDLPMNVPERFEEFRYAELMVTLPPDWPLSHKAFQDERNYWPMRCLTTLARFPHKYQTWLGRGHTVPNGDPPEPFTAEAGFTCVLLEVPLSVPPEFARLEVRPDKIIHFWSLIPIYSRVEEE